MSAGGCGWPPSRWQDTGSVSAKAAWRLDDAEFVEIEIEDRWWWEAIRTQKYQGQRMGIGSGRPREEPSAAVTAD